MDEFLTEIFIPGDFSNEKATKDQGEGPSAVAGDVSVPTSQVEEANDGCTTMTMKKYNAVGSDNDASEMMEKEELSIELSETESNELTAEAFTRSCTNSQSHNCWRS